MQNNLIYKFMDLNISVPVNIRKFYFLDPRNIIAEVCPLNTSNIPKYQKYAKKGTNPILWDGNNEVDKTFSIFYNTVNKLVNKHAHITTLSRHKTKQHSKP